VPKASSEQSIQAQVLEQLKEQSRLYSQKATLLSNMLEQAEQFLRQMPGKVPVQTQTDHSECELAFAKTGGDWRLVLIEFVNGSEAKGNTVTQGTILQKAEAARLLPELYQLLISKLTDGQEAIESGLRSLKELPFLDFSAYESLVPDSVNKKESSDEIPF
jgi:hypothetical protein